MNPPLTRSPQARWKGNPQAVEHLSTILDRNPALIDYLHDAYAIYVWDLPAVSDGVGGAISKAKAEGAKDLILTLIGMADQVPTRAKTPSGLIPPE